MKCPYCNGNNWSKDWVHIARKKNVTEPIDGGYIEYSFMYCLDCDKDFVTKDVYHTVEKGTGMTMDAFKARRLGDMLKSARRAAVIEDGIDKGSCPYCESRNGYTDAHVVDRDSDGELFAEWLFAKCVDCDHEVFVREVYVTRTHTLEYKIMNMEDSNDS